ncbi:MAG: hypothetical protein Fur0010_11340 [Bdellovibrio sp.]
MKIGILLALLMPAIAFSAPIQKLSEFTCSANGGGFTLKGVEQNCQDSRYQRWQYSGCYGITINDNGKEFNYEMVRSVPWHLEVQQRFYSMYVWDKDEWAMQGFILEFEPRASGNENRFEFDTRNNNRAPFKRTRGTCRYQN